MTAESALFAQPPGQGEPAAILRRGVPAAEVCSGSFVAQQAFNISIELESIPPSLEPGQEVVIACGPVGKRIVLLARFREMRGARAIFVRQSPWRPVDARLYPRYRTAITATVDSGAEQQPGRIIDISVGGAAVECEGSRHPRTVNLMFEGVPGSLPCRVVKQDHADGHQILHLQFESLASAARSHVQHLVESLGAEVEAGLLAS